MTREEILEMQPGRELDALVAEKVMDFKVKDTVTGYDKHIYRKVYSDPTNPHSGCSWKEHIGRLPDYSIDISAAWEVVEKMKRDHVHINVNWMDDQYCAEIIEMDPEEGYKYLGQCYDVPTAPEAIIKAALIAVNEE